MAATGVAAGAACIAPTITFGQAAFAQDRQTLPLTVREARLQRAQLDPDRIYIELELDRKSTEAFASFTQTRIGKTIALTIDGETVLRARLMETIRGGKIHIHLDNDAGRAQTILHRLQENTARVEVRAVD